MHAPTATKFYIASSGAHRAEVAEIAAYLESLGMSNAFPWHEHWEHRCSEEVCGVIDRRDLARREIMAAVDSHLFVGVARLGRGAHVELGAALAGGQLKRVILVGVDRADSVFYESCEVVATIDDLMTALRGG